MKRIFLLSIFLLALLLIGNNKSYAQKNISKDLINRLDLLESKEAIRQILVSYGNSFDTKNWELHKSLFTDSILMDFSASIGSGLTSMTSEQWVAGVKPFFQNLTATQHIGSVLSVDIKNDSAYATTMLHAQHFLQNSKGESVQRMIGYYDVWLIKQNSNWKIYKMVQHISWNEGNWYVFEKAAGLSK
jgi:hypothetical protein